MYNTGGAQGICQPAFIDYDVGARVHWLKSEIDRVADRRRVVRREREELQALAMLDPITTREAFGWFGTFLGLFPPAAIFCRIFADAFSKDFGPVLIIACVVMNVLCCAVGRAIGARLGKSIADTRKRSWLRTLLMALFFGILWGIVTGAAGGAAFIIIGAVFGVIFAAPIGAVSFLLFAMFHRVLARDGMIEDRQLWPLAFGLPCVIAAAILGAH